MDQKFSKSNFLAASEQARLFLCSALAEEVTRRFGQLPSWHDEVEHLVEQLRRLGHDLWSYDESDDFEIWGPNYADPTGPGIIVTFRLEGAEVEWTQR